MTHDPVSIPTPRVLRLVTVTSALAALMLAATPAVAQQRVAADPGAHQGMRYLSWPGKAERPRPAAPTYAAPSTEPPVPSGPIMSMPAQPVITPARPNRYSARTSPGPTPASAWIANGGAPVARYAPPPAMAYAEAPAPAYAPPPTYVPPYVAPVPGVPEPPRDYAPVPPTVPAYVAPPPALPQPPVYAEPAPTYAPPPPAPVHAPPPPVAADSGPAAMVEVAPAPLPPAPVAAPPPVPAAPVADPMAPRRDAPIFRLNRNNAPPAETLPEMAPEAEDEAPRPAPRTEAAPPLPPPPPAADDDRSPRRYSVHRANGQRPDRTPLPNPVMLDSMPVDLAAPPETPTVVRDANGRIQTIIPNEDPGLQ